MEIKQIAKQITFSDELKKFLEWQADEGTQVDTGHGMGASDFWVKVGGCEYFVSVRVSANQEKKDEENAVKYNGYKHHLQFRVSDSEEWSDSVPVQLRQGLTVECRIKPEQKPDVVISTRAFPWKEKIMTSTADPNLRLTFNAEGTKLITAEVL